MNKAIPEQQKGAQSNIEEQITLADEQCAKEHFNICRNRLLNVNKWQNLAGNGSAAFELFDESGQKLNRVAQKNDLFRIDIPPFKNDEKYDWVQIFEIESRSESNNSSELVAMHVSPAKQPGNSDSKIQHFFSEGASSSFTVERNNNTVKVGIYGRNESPNIEKTSTAGEAIRNAVIALGAIAGMSAIQWKKLAKGIISQE